MLSDFIIMEESSLMSIKITADSTCDLSPALLEQYDISILPLYVNLGGKTYRDGVDITPDDIFAHVAGHGALPSTAALNIADYHDFFSTLSPMYDAVIHLNISSEFSSCYQNACIAAQEFDNVYVVDSRNLSTGHGLLVIEAALAAQRGETAPDIAASLRELAGRVEASFVVDKLDYLAKGGRCSSVTALGANLLKLKPCIEVTDGKMHVGKKYRGSFSRVLAEYVKERLADRDDLFCDRIFITHTRCDEEIIRTVRDVVAQCGAFAEVLETTAGCTISCHCGPNTLGVLFIRSKNP